MMDRTFFDTGIRRQDTACEKWDDRQVLPDGAVAMWVADMDFPCAQPIQDAILQRAKHNCFGYTMVEDADLRAICDFVLRRHQLAITPDQTAMLPCVVSGLRYCVRALTKPGERVAVMTPVYGPFYRSIEENGRVVAPCALKKDANARYDIDFERLEELLKDGVRLVLACSPHNPVSRVWSREELQTLLTLTRRYHAALVVDEIHAEFVFAPSTFTPILALTDEKDDVISLMSASKTFNIAGLQQATLITKNPALLEAMKEALNAGGATCGNIFALTATRAAYEQCDDWLDGLLSYLADNIAILKNELKRLLPKAVLTPIEATYLAWIDLRAYVPNTEAALKKCLDHGVAFTGGTFFGAEGDGFVRLNFGCPAAQLKEGVRRLADAMNE